MVPPFPLGVAYVAAALKRGGHDVVVWDAMPHEDWQTSLRATIRECQPDAMGLSVRNVDDQGIRAPKFLLDEPREMAAVCREESDAPLIAGGAGFSMFPVEALEYLGTDYGIAGEGEVALNLLLDALGSGPGHGGHPQRGDGPDQARLPAEVRLLRHWRHRGPRAAPPLARASRRRDRGAG